MYVIDHWSASVKENLLKIPVDFISGCSHVGKSHCAFSDTTLIETLTGSQRSGFHA